MSLLTAERIKLFSTRAPWWCTALAIVASLGFAVVFVIFGGDEIPVTVSNTQTASSFGLTVILVLAVLAAATEYNWGTIRTTYQAVPKRAPALLAKAVVVSLWCGLVGLVIGFGSWGLGVLLKPDADLALNSAADWRAVAGQGLVFLFTGVLGVGVGMLLRSTALALAVTLVWTQLVEGLVFLIPGVGRDIYEWLPFFSAGQFIGGGLTASALNLGELPLGPLGYGAYYASICVILFVIGVVMNQVRDA
jgi:ABC-2 type transport system permease protein